MGSREVKVKERNSTCEEQHHPEDKDNRLLFLSCIYLGTPIDLTSHAEHKTFAANDKLLKVTLKPMSFGLLRNCLGTTSTRRTQYEVVQILEEWTTHFNLILLVYPSIHQKQIAN